MLEWTGKWEKSRNQHTHTHTHNSLFLRFQKLFLNAFLTHFIDSSFLFWRRSNDCTTWLLFHNFPTRSWECSLRKVLFGSFCMCVACVMLENSWICGNSLNSLQSKWRCVWIVQIVRLICHILKCHFCCSQSMIYSVKIKIYRIHGRCSYCKYTSCPVFIFLSFFDFIFYFQFKLL